MPTDSSEPETNHPGILRRLGGTAPVQVLVLLVLFSAAAWYEAAHLSALSGVDVWWHLSTGSWILQNHAVPHHGLFSQHANLPWMDSSWLFDVLLGAAYKLLGLRALPVLLMAFKLAIAVTLFGLARGSRVNFWPAVLLAATAQYAALDLPLGPVLCSIVLFAIELAILFGSRKSGGASALFWQPLLFLFWANLDGGFIFGLLALLLFCAVVAGEEIGRHAAEHVVPLRTLAISTVASVVAGFLTPYSFHLYGVAWQQVWSIAPYVRELRAMTFRQPQDYVLLLLAMTACFSLGRRRSRDGFQIALMVGCLALAFTRQRDTWLLALASVAVIANALPTTVASKEQERFWKREKLVTAALVAIVFLVVVIGRVSSGREALLNKVDETFPVRACDFIRSNRLPPPLFNAYDWGGFLTWYLPEYPVSIDSRTALYGDEINSRHFKLIIAAIPLNDDPSFMNARTILLPRKSPMAIALSGLPQFQVAYQDDIAMVLVARNSY